MIKEIKIKGRHRYSSMGVILSSLILAFLAMALYAEVSDVIGLKYLWIIIIFVLGVFLLALGARRIITQTLVVTDKQIKLDSLLSKKVIDWSDLERIIISLQIVLTDEGCVIEFFNKGGQKIKISQATFKVGIYEVLKIIKIKTAQNKSIEVEDKNTYLETIEDAMKYYKKHKLVRWINRF
ncbi:MAG: hypothetical protein HQ530_05270 [Parcubacteria group bacterium]|nr:hypothetical protein [Parcubacteria group bacterium]